MERLYRQSFLSALGKITIQSSDRGVRAILFGAESKKRKRDRKDGQARAEWVEANGQPAPGARWARQAIHELEEYLAGRRKQFTVALDAEGTSFQKKVWSALRTIPYGETRSYGEIARQVGNPQAARAVGMANHDNPVAILIPCHRVIASDGSLGGYAGGLKRKTDLLRLEQSNRGRS